MAWGYKNSAGKDLEDLVQAAITSSGGSRNIGEIVASTLPLTDAGLHLLDGSLISGSGAYATFVTYIANLYTKNPNANYFAQSQTTRTFNYTKAGTAATNIVENNGVLSGFTGKTAYVTVPAQTPTSSMELVLKIKQDTLTVDQSPIESSSNANGIVLRVVNASTGQINVWVGTASSNFINDVNTGLTLTAGTWTYIKVTWDGSTYNFYKSLDGETWTTGTPQTNKTKAPNLSNGIHLGGTSWENYPWSKGQIDLNGCYLKCDNTKVWQGYTDTNYTAEQMWQQSVTTHGVCGKFVYNSTNKTVRLPKITGILEGTVDVSALGDLVEAGLPNITGTWTNYQNGYGSGSNNNCSYKGALYNAGTNGTKASSGDTSSNGFVIGFDASRSNTIYGHSSTVQPQTIKSYYYIVIATSTKTSIQVDINEVATDLSGKADTDLSNVTPAQSFKSALVGWGLPDFSRQIDISSQITATNKSINIDQDSYIVFTINANASYARALRIDDIPLISLYGTSDNGYKGGIAPISKGTHLIRIDMTISSNVVKVLVVPCAGV